MCGSGVSIEMIMGGGGRNNKQLCLAFLGCESSKHTPRKHGGTKCELCIWLFFLAFFLSVCSYLHVSTQDCACALRRGNPRGLTAESKRQNIISQKTFGQSWKWLCLSGSCVAEQQVSVLWKSVCQKIVKIIYRV